ncbi:MAG: NAD-glutamate dehydrogenase, partial [Nakamurella sp.]
MTQTHVPEMDSDRLSVPPGDVVEAVSAVTRAAELRPDRASMIAAYFHHVPDEDLPKTPEDVLGIVDGHWRVGQQRLPGEVKIRVFNPAPSSSEGSMGWTDTKTVIDIVTDDMPSLVDSVVGALTMQNVNVHKVLHPILLGCRDADGNLQTVQEDRGRTPETRFNVVESWMHVLIDRLSDAERAETIEDALRHSLDNVRAVVGDGGALTGAAAAAAAELRGTFSPRSAQEVSEAADFLYWLIAGNMTFLGYCRHESQPGSAELAPATGSGLGILREDRAAKQMADHLLISTGEKPAHLLLTQASAGSALTRDIPPFEVRARILSSDGSVRIEHRFLGLFTPRALNAEITTTPVLRLVVQAVLATLGAAPDTYTGQRAMDLLATYPRAELFWAEPGLMVDVVSSVLQLASRRRLRAFLQPDPFGRFVSVMVYLPRDRYTTDCRLAMQQILLDAFNGTGIRYTARVGDSLLAAVHFTVSTDPGNPVRPELTGLTKSLRGTIRSWDDRLVAAVVGGGDEDLDTAGALSRYADAFDEGYKETYQADDAVADLRLLDQLKDPDDLALKMIRSAEGAVGDWRLKLYVTGAAVTLSRALPVLQTLGADVLDERPFEVRQS